MRRMHPACVARPDLSHKYASHTHPVRRKFYTKRVQKIQHQICAAYHCVCVAYLGPDSKTQSTLIQFYQKTYNFNSNTFHHFTTTLYLHKHILTFNHIYKMIVLKLDHKTKRVNYPQITKITKNG